MAKILIGNIKGPQGPIGPQGEIGPQGPEGQQGPLPPLINNATATEAGVAALDAAMGKTFQEQIDTANGNLTNKADKIVYPSMPSDASSAYVFAYKYPNAIAPYNGLNWTDMPTAEAGWYGRVETRGYFNDTNGGNILFYSNFGTLVASRGFKNSGWSSDWIRYVTNSDLVQREVLVSNNEYQYALLTINDVTRERTLIYTRRIYVNNNTSVLMLGENDRPSTDLEFYEMADHITSGRGVGVFKIYANGNVVIGSTEFDEQLRGTFIAKWTK